MGNTLYKFLGILKGNFAIFLSTFGKTCEKLSEKREIILRKFWNNLEEISNNNFKNGLKIFRKIRAFRRVNILKREISFADSIPPRKYVGKYSVDTPKTFGGGVVRGCFGVGSSLQIFQFFLYKLKRTSVNYFSLVRFS